MNCEIFLTNHASTDKDSISVVSIPKKANSNVECRHISPGRFHVPSREYSGFLDLYSKSIEEGELFHLAEKVPSVFPIIIDIDFKVKNKDRLYTITFVKNIIKIYNSVINKYLYTEELEPYKRDAFVFEKDEPSFYKNEIYKDGLHIMYPYLVTNYEIQKKIREDVIVCIKEEKPISFTTENSVEDIFDAAILRGNWMMYGSVKHDIKYSYSYSITKDNTEVYNEYSIEFLIKTCSIREKDSLQIESLISEDETEDDEESQHEEKHQHSIEYTKEEIRKMVMLFSQERADNYESWLNVGICLKTIRSDFFDIWVDFSKKSDKFDLESLKNSWRTFSNRNKWHISSIKYWAKQDNPEEYQKLQHEMLHDLMIKSLSRTPNDIARVCAALLGNFWECSSPKFDIWYSFEKHFWKKIDDVTVIYQFFTNNVIPVYQKFREKYFEKLNHCRDDDEQGKKLITETLENIGKVIKDLKKTNFKSTLQCEMKELLYNAKLEKKFHLMLDENPNLLGFKNGVLDLSENKVSFREGLPEDMLSKHLTVNYVEYTPDNKHYKNVWSFLCDIFPDEELREYMMIHLSRCLTGYQSATFHILTGNGANGKSTLMELLQKIFGDNEDSGLYTELPPTILTKPQKDADAAMPSFTKAIGKRVVTFQEPEKNDKIYMGFVKRLTGEDMVQTRSLYKDPIDFRPQFELFLCCNDLPDCSSLDGGTVRRLRVAPFVVKFVDNPDPENPLEKKKHSREYIRKQLFHKNSLEAFAFILTQYWEKFCSQNKTVALPKQVTAATDDYKAKNDKISEFIKYNIEHKSNEILKIKDVLFSFRCWIKDMYLISKPTAQKQEVVDKIMEYFSTINKNTPVTTNGIVFWNICLINNKEYEN